MTFAQAYARDGFARVNAVLSAAELAALDDELTQVWTSADRSGADPQVQWRMHETLGQVADRIDPIVPRAPHVAALSTDRRLLALADIAVGGRAMVFKDKFIAKWPGASGYKPHQDYAYWAALGIPADAMCTAMIAIDAAPPERGPLAIWVGQHNTLLPGLPDEPRDIDPATLAGTAPVLVPMAAGDAVFFHSLAPHQSDMNRDTTPRRALFFSYARAEFAAQIAEYQVARNQFVSPDLRRRLQS